MEETAVGFEVDDSARTEELAITLEEKRTGQTAVLALQLRIRKRQPNLTNLPRAEKRLYELYPRPQKRHITNPFLSGRLSASPESRSLDIHADIIPFWDSSGQINSVLSFSAAKLQNNRLVIVEHHLIPMTFNRMFMELQALRRISSLVQNL